MPAPPRPQEILEHIVDCARHDQSSLKNLALTSRRLVERCQTHLYRTLRIYLIIPPSQRAILEHNPSLFKHVKELELTFDLHNPPAHEQLALSLILEELRGLESIRIRSRGCTSWKGVSPLCRSMVARLLCHPARQLAIYQIFSIPLHLAYAALTSTVEKFTLIEASFGCSGEPVDMARSHPLKIKALRCYGEGTRGIAELVAWATTQQQLPVLNNVISLHLNFALKNRIAYPYIRYVTPVLQNCSHLKGLTLEYPSSRLLHTAYAEAALNGGSSGIPTMHSLRYLRVLLTADDEATVLYFVPRLLRAILSVNPQPALELLDIKIPGKWPLIDARLDHALNGGRDNAILLPEDHAWDIADETLSNTALCPSLNYLRLALDVKFHAIQTNAQSILALKLRGMFGTEILAAMEATRSRLLAFDGGGEDIEAGRAFREARKSILEQEDMDYA